MKGKGKKGRKPSGLGQATTPVTTHDMCVFFWGGNVFLESVFFRGVYFRRRGYLAHPPESSRIIRNIRNIQSSAAVRFIRSIRFIRFIRFSAAVYNPESPLAQTCAASASGRQRRRPTGTAGTTAERVA